MTDKAIISDRVLASDAHRANVKFHSLLADKYRLQPFHSPENRLRVRGILESLRSRTAGLRLLDIGCGDGFIFDLAHDLFAELNGVDITPEMIIRMHAYPNAKATLAAAEDLPYRSDSFDLVTCYGVLHHLQDLRVALNEIWRVLKPGGFFYADESPSQEYRDLVSGLAETGFTTSRNGLLEKEIHAVVDDPKRYEDLYGIPAEITRGAMVQNYNKHGLTEQNLRTSLQRAGFDDVSIEYRRFIGEDQLRRERGEEAVTTVRHHLCSLFPLTRPLFKYFLLTATTGRRSC